MKESRNNLVTFICIGLLGLTFVKNSFQSQVTANTVTTPVVAASLETPINSPSPVQQNKPLKMSITVDNPNFLKVREGDEIRIGDIISDNSLERERLERQKKGILLQTENIKNKLLVEPTPPPPTPELRSLPPATFSEEQAAIAQAELKLQQAKSVLQTRKTLLNTDSPEQRAEFERSGFALQSAQQKIEEQGQMLQSMKDLGMEPAVIQHEEALLKRFQSAVDEAQSGVDRARAKLDASAISQSQELQQLQINVQLAESELQSANSRLTAAINRRKMQEYAASVEEAKREQSIIQSRQEFEKQQAQYQQSLRERDYQLAQLQISLSNIDDKIAQIPAVRSPRNGVVRKVKAWEGKNGKYSTVVTISNSSSFSTKSSGANSIGSTANKANSPTRDRSGTDTRR